MAHTADTSHRPSGDQRLSDVLIERLAAQGIATLDEVSLRLELERRTHAYTLFRLPPAAARKWKARYRIMLGADYFDSQTVAEAYARAILATTATSPSPQDLTPDA